jgi:type II secretory pathway component GspD/PulD (secretin)
VVSTRPCLVVLTALVLAFEPEAGRGQPPRGVDQPKPAAIQLVAADAECAAARLRVLVGPGAVVTADRATNTVFLRADARGLARARRLLARLDAPRNNYFVRLDHADPARAAKVVGAVVGLLAFLSGDPEVGLFPLERHRAIFVTATAEQIRCVTWLVRQLEWWLLRELIRGPGC